MFKKCCLSLIYTLMILYCIACMMDKKYMQALILAVIILYFTKYYIIIEGFDEKSKDDNKTNSNNIDDIKVKLAKIIYNYIMINVKPDYVGYLELLKRNGNSFLNLIEEEVFYGFIIDKKNSVLSEMKIIDKMTK